MCIEYETSRCTISLLEYRGTISTRLKGHLSLMKPLAVDGHTTNSDGVLIGTSRGPRTWEGRRVWPESAEEQAIAATAPRMSRTGTATPLGLTDGRFAYDDDLKVELLASESTSTFWNNGKCTWASDHCAASTCCRTSTTWTRKCLFVITPRAYVYFSPPRLYPESFIYFRSEDTFSQFHMTSKPVQLVPTCTSPS